MTTGSPSGIITYIYDGASREQLSGSTLPQPVPPTRVSHYTFPMLPITLLAVLLPPALCAVKRGSYDAYRLESHSYSPACPAMHAGACTSINPITRCLESACASYAPAQAPQATPVCASHPVRKHPTMHCLA